MMSLRLSATFGAAALLFLFVSCSDPSGVGLGVGPDSLGGGAPQVERVTPETLRTATSPPVTGIETVQQVNWRFLTGAVSDYGRITAEGYLDFVGRGELPSSLVDAPAGSLAVQLRLQPEYLHGDTSGTVTFRLYDLTQEADMSQAPADTTFPSGPEIARYERSVTDSLLTFSLPEVWVRENVEALRDTSDGGGSSEDAFHGFRLTASTAEVVVGVDHSTATLRLRRPNLDVSRDFSVLKSFTNIERTDPPVGLPNDRFLVQAGVGQSLVVRWNQSRLDSLRGTPLNNAEILIPTDSTALADRGNSFVRPPARSFRLVGTRVPSAPSCGRVRTSALSNSECVLPLVPDGEAGTVRADPRTAFAIFQQSLVEDSSAVFSRYRVEVTDRLEAEGPQSTLSSGLPSTIPVLVPAPDVPDLASPRLELVVTPL